MRKLIALCLSPALLLLPLLLAELYHLLLVFLITRTI